MIEHRLQVGFDGQEATSRAKLAAAAIAPATATTAGLTATGRRRRRLGTPSPTATGHSRRDKAPIVAAGRRLVTIASGRLVVPRGRGPALLRELGTVLQELLERVLCGNQYRGRVVQQECKRSGRRLSIGRLLCFLGVQLRVENGAKVVKQVVRSEGVIIPALDRAFRPFGQSEGTFKILHRNAVASARRTLNDQP